MKFAICHELFENWDWERQCRFIAEVGYTGIELAPFTLAPRITDVSAEQRRTLKKQAADHGLQIMGLHWLLAKTEGLHVTTRDVATRRRTAEYLKELANACARLWWRRAGVWIARAAQSRTRHVARRGSGECAPRSSVQ